MSKIIYLFMMACCKNGKQDPYQNNIIDSSFFGGVNNIAT